MNVNPLSYYYNNTKYACHFGALLIIGIVALDIINIIKPGLLDSRMVSGLALTGLSLTIITAIYIICKTHWIDHYAAGIDEIGTGRLFIAEIYDQSKPILNVIDLLVIAQIILHIVNAATPKTIHPRVLSGVSLALTGVSATLLYLVLLKYYGKYLRAERINANNNDDEYEQPFRPRYHHVQHNVQPPLPPAQRNPAASAAFSGVGTKPGFRAFSGQGHKLGEARL